MKAEQILSSTVISNESSILLIQPSDDFLDLRPSEKCPLPMERKWWDQRYEIEAKQVVKFLRDTFCNETVRKIAFELRDQVK